MYNKVIHIYLYIYISTHIDTSILYQKKAQRD